MFESVGDFDASVKKVIDISSIPKLNLGRSLSAREINAPRASFVISTMLRSEKKRFFVSLYLDREPVIVLPPPSVIFANQNFFSSRSSSFECFV